MSRGPSTRLWRWARRGGRVLALSVGLLILAPVAVVQGAPLPTSTDVCPAPLAGENVVADATSGDDTLHGTSGPDLICAGDGADIVYGYEGNDRIYGQGGDDLILDGIIAHTGELRSNPEKYQKFLRAIYRAIDYFNNNQDKAIPIIAKQFSITPDDFKATLPNFHYTPYERSKELMGAKGQEGRIYEVFREAMDLNLEFGSSDVKLNPEDHLDNTLINQVQKNWQ